MAFLKTLADRASIALGLRIRKWMDFFMGLSKGLLICLVLISRLWAIYSFQRESSKFIGTALRVSPPQMAAKSQRLTMKLSVGILGLPNVGKSSLFNAMARQALAQAANFPFCTIDPTTCLVPCNDPFLDLLAAWSPPTNRRRVPATMEWVDVAGLAKNAHRGDGLGNQFLGTLRDCTCLCHVVRAFEDPSVLVHEQGDEPCNPLRDLETIQLELVLSDLAHVQRRLERINGSKDDHEEERSILEYIQKGLQDGIPSRALGLSLKQQTCIRSMGLLTLKPIVYAFNVDEVDFFLDHGQTKSRALKVVRDFESAWKSQDDILAVTTEPPVAIVCASVESKLAQSSPAELSKYLNSIGVDTTSSSETHEDGTILMSARAHSLCYDILPELVRQLLGYSIIYTGPGVPLERSQTTRAHLIPTCSCFTAYDLAGRIHGDIQRNFLRAQVVDAVQLLSQATDFAKAKESGIVRSEGKDYVLQDGEVVLIQWKG